MQDGDVVGVQERGEAGGGFAYYVSRRKYSAAYSYSSRINDTGVWPW